MTPPKPTQLWDVAVLGTQLGGLVAAALLVREGLKVLVVDEGTAVEAGGFRLPAAPSLVPDLSGIPVVREVFAKLSVFVRPEPVSLQVLLPRARLELARDPARRSRELDRAFRGEATAIASLLSQAGALADLAAPALASQPPLPAAGLLDRFSLAWLARRHREAFEARLPWDEGHPLDGAMMALHEIASVQGGRPGAFSFARATLPLLSSPHRLAGGLAALLRTGDAVRAELEEVAFESGAFALRLRGQPVPYRARVAIAARDLSGLAPLLPRRKKVEALAGAVRRDGALLVRSLVLDEAGIPPGLGEAALVAMQGVSGLLENAPASRSDGTPAPGLRTLTFSSTADGAAVDRVLEDLLPFHRRHLRVAADAPLRRRLETGPRRLGVEGLPLRSPVPRLLLAGDEALPGLGLEGAFLAGMRAAGLAIDLCRKVRPIG